MGKKESKLDLPKNLKNALYNGAICSIYFYVYTYEDPKSGNTVYVGKGNGFRAWNHLNQSSNRRLNNLIQARLRAGYNMLPTIVEFFENSKEAIEKERELITSIGRSDLNLGTLFNVTDGGQGAESVFRGEGIEFRGELYPNVSALNRKYGVDNAVYRTRIKLNWTMEEALGLVPKKDKTGPKNITVGDRTWSSLREFAEDTIFKYDHVRHLINYGMSYEEILNRDRGVDRVGSEVWCHGEHYPSRAFFARKIKKSINAVGYWLDTGWTPEEIADGKVINRTGLYFDWRGTTITQTEFTKIANLHFSTLIKYRKKGLSYEEIYRLGHRPLAIKWGGKPILYKGKNYNSQIAFNIEELGIAKTTLSKWLHTFKMTPEECIECFTLAKRISLTRSCSFKGCLSSASEIIRGKEPLIELKGEIVTKDQLRNICRTQLKNINNLLKKCMSGDEIFSWSEINRGNSPKVEPFLYDGKEFLSYSQLDHYLGIKGGLIGSFRRRGFSFEEIKTLIKNANDLMQNGVSEVKAFFTASYELTIKKNGGRKLPPKVEEYIRLRKLGTDPKKSADLSGVSKSNTARLEKTHQKLIN